MIIRETRMEDAAILLRPKEKLREWLACSFLDRMN
jgi:hypothetical protein